MGNNMVQKEQEKFQKSNLLEGMTSISALLDAGEINDRPIERIWIDRAKRRSKAAEISFLRAMASKHGFPIEFVDAEQIDALTIGSTHGGILAFCGERTIPSLTREVIEPNRFYLIFFRIL